VRGDYTVDVLHSLTTNKYKFWTAADFAWLTALLVCRLTLFNARRDGEPAKLMLSEWQNAEDNKMVNSGLVKDVHDQYSKHLEN